MYEVKFLYCMKKSKCYIMDDNSVFSKYKDYF